MTNTVEAIESLIRLAVHPASDRNEAASAALKAVKLIDKFSIPIGADVTMIRGVEDYKPPTAEEMSTIDQILQGKQKPETAREYSQKHHERKAEGLITQDNTPMTGQDAFRLRLIDAWREIRDQRVRLQAEIYRYELETHRKFRGEGGLG